MGGLHVTASVLSLNSKVLWCDHLRARIHSCPLLSLLYRSQLISNPRRLYATAFTMLCTKLSTFELEATFKETALYFLVA